MSIVLCSGGFDPLHDGHLDYLEDAHQYGRVIVALNSDAWLQRKRGRIFIPWTARARILKALKIVYDVTAVDDADGTVCEALRSGHYDYFANGGDRLVANSAEHEACKEAGIEELFDIGGPKVRSSSTLFDIRSGQPVAPDLPGKRDR